MPQPLKYNQFGYGVNGPVYIPGQVQYATATSCSSCSARSGSAIAPCPPTPPRCRRRLMRQGNFSELLRSEYLLQQDLHGRRSHAAAALSRQHHPGQPAQRQWHRADERVSAARPGIRAGQCRTTSCPTAKSTTRAKTRSRSTPCPREKDTIRLRVLNYSFFVPTPFRARSRWPPNQLDRPNQTASLNYIHVFRPNLINEALVTASADHVDITLRGTAWQRSQYGVNYPYLYGAAAKDFPDKMPTVNINGFTQLDNGPYPSRSGGPIYGFSDNVTWVHGNHTFKFGVRVRTLRTERPRPGERERHSRRRQQSERPLRFPGHRLLRQHQPRHRRPGSGTLQQLRRDRPARLHISRGNMFEFFAQDSWKVTPKLKLELGVRETILQPYYALWGNYDVFDARFYDPKKAVSIDPRTGSIIPGSGNIYNGMVIPGDSIPAAGKGRFPGSGDPALNALFHGLPKTYADWQKNQFRAAHRRCLSDQPEDRGARRLRRFQEPAGGFRLHFPRRQLPVPGLCRGHQRPGGQPRLGFRRHSDPVHPDPGSGLEDPDLLSVELHRAARAALGVRPSRCSTWAASACGWSARATSTSYRSAPARSATARAA